MQEANERTVLGDFAGAKFSYAGTTSRFFRRDKKFYVHTDGPDGKLADYEIRYTFGVSPLQQYLIELPGSSLQGLGIAWDARPKDAGGQRWFHLYPKDKIDFHDVLHWTGPAQNWNHMCAECHSTGVRKKYDPEKDRFATSWTEIDVSCEACHGAGSRHLAWANGERTAGDPAKGFEARLAPGHGTWTFDAGAPIARLSGPRDTSAQLESCGRCHSRRTDAARCVACHMPSRLYMVVDRRHDHGFRVPRPDLSVSLGTPNACTDCHRDRPAAWVSEAVAKWYGPTRARGPSWAPALAAGRRREAGAGALLAAVAAEPASAIVRATAVDLLARSPAAARPDLVERALHDPDPLVRRAGLGLLLGIEPPKRWDIGGPPLADPVRTVRLDAVRAAPGVPVPAAERATFDRAVEEYRAAQAPHADRADAWLNLGALAARLGDGGRAEEAYRRAIRLQPSFMPPYVNLADLYRAQGRDPEGERVLREALAREPGAADVHHALGLLLVRGGRRQDALAELGRAAELAPDVPRYAYAYALGLDATGERAKALSVLADAQRRFTGEREILEALVQLSLAAGDADASARWAQKLRDLDGGAR